MTPQQSKMFPLFFQLERVSNGFILTAKEETDGMSEAQYQKEVVATGDIEARIGRLLRLTALNPGQTAVFHVEAVGQEVYKIDTDLPPDALAEAKLAFVHFNSQKLGPGTVNALHVKDSDTIEVYGKDAEKASRENGIPLTRVGAIPMLVFPNTKEGRNSLSACFAHINLSTTTHDKLMEWYNSRKVLMSK